MSIADLVYYIGQGKVYAASRASAGAVNGGELFLGDVAELKINHAKQDWQMTEENTTGFGGTADASSVAIPIAVSLQLKQWSVANLEKAVYGTSSGAQTSGTVTNEVFSGYSSASAHLAHLGVSSVSLKANSSGGTALVEGTDYTLDPKFGLVTFLSSSAVVSGSGAVPIYANYSYEGYNGSIAGIASQPPEYQIRLDGYNVTVPDGAGSFAAVQVTINRVKLKLSKELDLLSKKYGVLDLEGDILYDSTAPVGTSPYYTITKA